LSRFEQLPSKPIIDNIIMKMEAKQPMSTLPALTFNADMMAPDVAEILRKPSDYRAETILICGGPGR